MTKNLALVRFPRWFRLELHCKNRWVGFTQKNWVASWVSRLRTPISGFALFLPKHMFLGRKYPKCKGLSEPKIEVWVGSWVSRLRTPISGFGQFLPKHMFLGRKYPKCNGLSQPNISV